MLGRPRDLKRTRNGVWLVVSLGLFLAACAVDGWVWRNAVVGKGVESEDWYRLLRLAGWLPTWLWVAAVLLMAGWQAAGRSPAPVRGWGQRLNSALTYPVALVLAVGISGGLADGLKVLLRRVRPNSVDGAYVFRDWSGWPGGWWDGTGLGLPSSHAAVAFAGMLIMSRLIPGAWPALLALAAGCALSRVIVGAHFLSDTVLAACLAWAVSAWVWQAHRATQTLKTRLAIPDRDADMA